MIRTYNVRGMTCSSCQEKVQRELSKVKGVKSVTINLSKGEASIESETPIGVSDLRSALNGYPKYQLSEDGHQHIESATREETKSWIETYKPIFLIFAYISMVTVLVEIVSGSFIWDRWMRYFMAGFFLVFSFFKLLDLRGFAERYSTYDIIAKRWSGWGYVYAFIELALGIAFLTDFSPLVTNGVTFVVMTISIIGVLQSVLNKRKIKCACLGAVFNLPMSTITIIEDALMIGMSVIALAAMVNS
jgi:copper chaperone CopZ